ncbi:TonB-dependent receptor domain-containing protein [Ferruginibacter yonginensis]|uniref:TonB-dependent receptor domain-containing protein n=1 Tax=Ferruginibacter yonginensis TaxID=1310416 RepID=A0ABV8QRK5_9BACT
MKNVIFLLFSCCIITNIYAQKSNSITGKIIDNQYNKPLIAATITLVNVSNNSLVKAAVADSTGSFILENFKTGTYLLQVVAVGFEKYVSKNIVIDATNSNVSLGTISLKQQQQVLNTVIVASKKPFVEQKLDKTIINVESQISNAGANALEVLEKSPGVTVDKDGNISLKGKPSVIVLIDGKQTYMSAQDLYNYLQTMSAANLETIELMPNPSAKYDAAGNAGVINIKTKKLKQKGFNGSASTSYGRGNYGNYSNALNLNYKNGKFNMFANVSAGHRKNYQILGIHRAYFNNAGTTTAIFDQEATFVRNRNNYNAKVGVDFMASKKTTFGAVFTGSVAPGKQDGANTSFLKDGLGNINSVLQANSYDYENWKNKGLNLNTRHTFDSVGTEISLDVDVLQYKSKHTQNFLSENFDPSGVKQTSELLQSNLPATINVTSAKIDFTHPITSTLKMEAGVKTSFVNTDNIAGYFNIMNNTPVIDNEKTNHFKYNENINAAYVNVNKTWGKWSLQTGLRAENTNYSGKQFDNPLRSDSSFKRSYTGLFPTVFASYDLNNKHQVAFSYGRRISRPDYESLNPFVFFIDKYTYEAGNPFLKPMFADVFTLTHSYNKFLSSNITYAHNKNMFNEYFQPQGYATIVKQENFGVIDDISISVNAQVAPYKWWNMNLYTEFNYNEVNAGFNGYNINTSGNGFSANMNNQIKLGKGWGTEVSGFYRSQMQRGQFNISSIKQINTAFSKQVLKNKGMVKLSFNDILRSNKQAGAITIQNTIANFTQRRDSRTVFISFNYKFGKQFKTQQRRTSAASDELNRIKAN